MLLKKSILSSSKNTLKKPKVKELKREKKQLKFSPPSYYESYWPGNFDWQKWHRAKVTASLEEVEETSYTEERVDCTIVFVEHVIKAKKKTASEKLKARLTAVGI